MDLLRELKLISEGAEDERFFDVFWEEMLKRGVDEDKLERAFSGKGASVTVEKYYKEVINDLPGPVAKSTDKKAIGVVADKLLGKFGRVFGVK